MVQWFGFETKLNFEITKQYSNIGYAISAMCLAVQNAYRMTQHLPSFLSKAQGL